MISRRTAIAGGFAAACGAVGQTAPTTVGDQVVYFDFWDGAGAIALSELLPNQSVQFRTISPSGEHAVEIADCAPPMISNVVFASGSILIPRCGRNQLGVLSLWPELQRGLATEISEWVSQNGGVFGPSAKIIRNATQELNLICSKNGRIALWSDDAASMEDVAILNRAFDPSALNPLLGLTLWPFRHQSLPGEKFVFIRSGDRVSLASAHDELSGSLPQAIVESLPSDSRIPCLDGMVFGRRIGANAGGERGASLDFEDGAWIVTPVPLPSESNLLGRTQDSYVCFGRDKRRAFTIARNFSDQDTRQFNLPDTVAQAIADTPNFQYSPPANAVLFSGPSDSVSIFHLR